MDRLKLKLGAFAHFVHAHFLWLLFASYLAAGLFPALGLAIRSVSFGEIGPAGAGMKVSLSMIMLASLLLNAGLGVRLGEIRNTLRSPGVLGLAMAANLLVPIGFIGFVNYLMRGWHNADEVQNILVGLALVASMPIAGSSTAWAQNADGEIALSLGLVLFSTLLSPLTTPIALHAVGFLTTGDYSEDLHELAQGGTGAFLTLGVLAPALLGIALRWIVGDRRIGAARPALKLINSSVLLTLNYANAAVSLPEAVREPDSDFLAVTLAIVLALCVLAFSAGWLVARVSSASPSQRISLMFGLGMNNNGTGLVLASMALADHPRVMLPIIFYNLLQHLVAGFVDRFHPTLTNLDTPYDRLSFGPYTALDREARSGKRADDLSKGFLRRTLMLKRTHVALVAIAGLSVLMTSARADGTKIALDQVPDAVKSAVKKKFPKAEIKAAEKEVEDGKTTFELSIKDGDTKITVSAKDDGTILEVEKEIDAKDLPAAVATAVKTKYPAGTVKKAEEVTEGEKVTYEVIVTQEGKKSREIALEKSGKILEDQETEGEDD